MIDFVDSDTTFLNGTLAALYGLEKTVTGPEMRKVILEDTNRGGILGMPGILATTKSVIDQPPIHYRFADVHNRVVQDTFIKARRSDDTFFWVANNELVKAA